MVYSISTLTTESVRLQIDNNVVSNVFLIDQVAASIYGLKPDVLDLFRKYVSTTAT